MGISEQARNITDTSLRQVVNASDDPVRALKEHVLRLEGSLRELAAAEEVLVKQCEWLASNIERNLKLAESEEARAGRLLGLGQEASARQALAEKRESLVRVTADQKQLRKLEASLPGLRGQAQELRERIEQAKAVRARIAASEPISDEDLHGPAAHEPVQPKPGPAKSSQGAFGEDELDREVERLRRRIENPGNTPKSTPEDRA